MKIWITGRGAGRIALPSMAKKRPAKVRHLLPGQEPLEQFERLRRPCAARPRVDTAQPQLARVVAAREQDAVPRDVAREPGRGLLERVLDRPEDLPDGRHDRGPDLFTVQIDRGRQPAHQMPSPNVERLLRVERDRRADRDLDLLGRPGADREVV